MGARRLQARFYVVAILVLSSGTARHRRSAARRCRGTAGAGDRPNVRCSRVRRRSSVGLHPSTAISVQVLVPPACRSTPRSPADAHRGRAAVVVRTSTGRRCRIPPTPNAGAHARRLDVTRQPGPRTLQPLHGRPASGARRRAHASPPSRWTPRFRQLPRSSASTSATPATSIRPRPTWLAGRRGRRQECLPFAVCSSASAPLGRWP